MKNMLVAKIFYEIADMLEMQDVQFKPQAYRRAARSIESLSKPIEEIAKGGVEELMKIPGVGESIAEKIEEIVATGKLKYYEDLKSRFPIKIDEMFSVEGLGPKKIKLFYKKLGIKTLDDLERAAKAGKLSKLPGMGEKSEQKILESIEFARGRGMRILLGYILPTADEIKERMKEHDAVELVEVVGSIRRMKETIGDIDVLVVTKRPKEVTAYFTGLPNVDAVVAKGPARSTVRLKEGIECDCRVFKRNSFGAAMMYFTGSKEHNIELRKIAIKHGWKLNEYGLFKADKQIAGATEQEVFNKLGLQFVPPEMRENTGEVELALKNKLPKIIGYGDVRGDLQMHTKWSDGSNTIEEMARAAKQLGYEYICISDHVGTLRIANSVDERELVQQRKEIEKVQKKIGKEEKGITILQGAEVNILSNGKLDMKDSVLAGLDVVVASVHGGFRQSEEQITRRIVAAMENENVDIIAHPTGREIQKRKPYDVNLEKLFEVSKRTGTILEINSYPSRLDLNADNIRRAIELGCKLVIDTDAHSVEHLRYMRLGIATARRGWAQKKDVVNTLPLKELLKVFKK